MKSISYVLIFCTLILLFLFVSNLNSQTIHVCESTTETGEPIGEKSSIKMDFTKENFVYILVNFSSAYGQDEIKFKRFVMGQPNPVISMSVDPAATWVVYEMYIPQAGEYIFTVFDKNDVEQGKGYITIKNK
ncbi:MAG: hypothetical protein HOP31_14045 [Ignavibacteria bacterium]|nr:hypothetical protein [Ignavibacteria bacterium]